MKFESLSLGEPINVPCKDLLPLNDRVDYCFLVWWLVNTSTFWSLFVMQHTDFAGTWAGDNTTLINGEKTYICGICNKAFVTNTRLSDHVKYVHLHSEPMVCEFCNKTYKHYNSLRKHIWHAHRNRGNDALISDPNVSAE
jgi:C2H2-type zinc finger